MRNIEIKARVADLEAAAAIAHGFPGARFGGTLRQVDTYFRVAEGRLKLREVSGAEERCELIFYRRPETAGPKPSDYEVAAVARPAELQKLLAVAFGVRSVVRKERTVWLVGNVRIHLDRVEGLGSFVEFEAVMPDDADDAAGEGRARELMEAFSIKPGELVATSYGDLVEGKSGGHNLGSPT